MEIKEILDLVLRVDNIWIYALIFFFAYIENIFPPSPSDVVIVFCASLSGLGKTDFTLTLISAVVGSTLGFMTMYFIGDKFGDEIIEKGKIKFINPANVKKVEKLFSKFGYFLIIINRFLAGTRAFVAFFAGLGEFDPKKSILLSLISALIWYSILVTAGKMLGENWEIIANIISSYSKIITITLTLLLIFYIARNFLKSKKR
ncbi:membrane protein DedA, SNARE-associated domain [Candidatus Thermokryptus mobilis]|uniref:Membrane protein DedA, SNARE-associated domain n=1 Tax=Candidatus Thermokryptus mobilis TaxID=1643428 RepID=A0A0S4MSE6_9BACT|nr:DedA family protein [Candidatus Thermokryptus mobilis]CUU01927.1 membrane protein DedA, SNARE-associated domain [Candidatus Thermokryptus mobilis]